MAGRKAAASAEPKKLDSALPAQPAEAGMVRAKASRPTFRRGGLVFNDRTWTDVAPEIGAAAVRAIIADPVLTIQINDPKAGWRALTDEERSMLAEAADALDATRAADETDQAPT